MRSAILVSVLTAVLLVGATAVYAGPPLDGIWKSSDGDFDEGTATTTRPPSGYLGTGARLNGRSIAGGVFTNDWAILCPTVVLVTALGPPLGSNGIFDYMLTYQGGFVTLGGPGNPWDGGDGVYTAKILSYVEIRTIQMSGSSIVGAVSDHVVSAQLQGYEGCMTWAVGNGVLRGSIPASAGPKFDNSVLQSVKGADYPGYTNNVCAPNPGGAGHWEDIRDLTVSIMGCTVATEQSTWGSVKAMYRE